MPSERVFATWWAKWETRWGKQPKEKMADYLDWIRPLTDEQTEAAMRELYARSDFFPKAQAIMDYAPPVQPKQLPLPEKVQKTCGCGSVIYVLPDVTQCFRCHLRAAGLEAPEGATTGG